MYQSFEREQIDPSSPYRPCHYGVFEIPLSVGTHRRRMLMYIPEDVREATSGILVLGENGTTADELLHNSPWCALADQDENKEKMIIYFLEPENGVWNTEEAYGTPDGDVAYIQSAVDYVASNHYECCVHEAKRYVVGCREGGALAQMAVANNPVLFAGVASIGAPALNPSYLQSVGDDACTQLSGFVDSQNQIGLKKRDITVPAWIIDDPAVYPDANAAALQYWCDACHAAAQPRQVAPDTVEYYRDIEPRYGINQHKEAYRVWYSAIPHASDHHAERLARRVWRAFLTRQRRWLGSPDGDLRRWYEPVQELGMEYHYEQFDGWMREWYVYIPQAVRQAPEKKVPLVFAMHGYTCNGEIYANHTEWHRVAEQEQFIAVFPTALYGTIEMTNDCIDPKNTPLTAWNIFQEDDRPDELRFFTMLLDRMCRDYPVDPTRVFATGHSWGSLMTQMLALAMPKRFAAVAPCSGVFFGGAEQRMLPLEQLANRPDIEIPVWMFCGEEEEFLIHACPQHDNSTGFNINMWLKNNHMEAQIPADWNQHEYMAHGRWHDRAFYKQNVPMVQFTSVQSMGHSTMTDMTLRIWHEFFSHFSRIGEDVHYENTEVHSEK